METEIKFTLGHISHRTSWLNFIYRWISYTQNMYIAADNAKMLHENIK